MWVQEYRKDGKNQKRCAHAASGGGAGSRQDFPLTQLGRIPQKPSRWGEGEVRPPVRVLPQNFSPMHGFGKIGVAERQPEVNAWAEANDGDSKKR